MTLDAPAKLNLCLFVGPPRRDGLHEIRSIFQPLDLADRLVVTDGVSEDEVICPGIEGPEIAAHALQALRASGWDRPPIRIEIEKQIPVAAGLGGGSADAAAVLRLADGDLGADELRAIAAELGADVPSQLAPGLALVSGAGEQIQPLPPARAYGVVLVPFEPGLTAREVYSELDRRGSLRDPAELAEIEERLLDAAAGGAPPQSFGELLVNDLQPIATTLRPAIAGAIEALEQVGAATAQVTGSGPTVFGLFEDLSAARRAGDSLKGLYNPVITAPCAGGA